MICLIFLQIVDNPADVAEKADRIITMLPSSPNVIEVYTGSNGILKYTSSSARTRRALITAASHMAVASLQWICFFSLQKSEERLPPH